MFYSDEVHKFAEEGNYNWKVLGFFAGILLMLDGFFGFFIAFTSLDLSRALINLYLVLFGAICSMLEFKGNSFTEKYVENY